MSFDPATALYSRLVGHFSDVGYRFRRSASEFRRLWKSGNVTAVWVDLLAASQQGYFKAAVSAHIRIDAIEAVYVEHHPFIPPPERKAHFTLSVNCDNLFRNKGVSHSVELLSEQAVDAFARRLWVAIQADVFEFLDRYSDQRALVENLKEEDYQAWVTSDRMVRCLVLLCDRAIAGDRSGFERWSAELLAYCQKPYGRMFLPAAEAIVPAVRLDYFGDDL